MQVTLANRCAAFVLPIKHGYQHDICLNPFTVQVFFRQLHTKDFNVKFQLISN